MPPSRSLAAIRRPATPSAIPARQSRPSCRQGEPVAASGRASTVSISAASSTVRVIGPRWATVPNGDNGQAGTRPKVGFSPTMPQKAAGMRIEPPPSVPRCRAPCRGAAATAAPPLEPPAVRLVSHGLRADLAQRVVGHRLPAELGRGGLAEQHRAGLAQPGGGGRVLSVRRGTGRRPAAAPGREPAHQDDVLDRRRHAVEGPAGLAARPPRLGRPRGREGALAIDHAERADRRVPAADPGQAVLGHLDRRQLAPPVQLQEVAGRTQARRGGVHPVLPRRRPWR